MSTPLLEHRIFLESRFEELDLRLSEYNFTNLYCFEEVHQFRFDPRQPDWIEAKNYDGFVYSMPLIKPKVKPKKPPLISQYPIVGDWLSLYSDAWFHKEMREGDGDYLYRREKLTLLPGRKLAAKRNLLYQIERDFEMEMISMHKGEPSTLSKAQEVLEKWREEQASSNQGDYLPCQRALHFFHELRCDGFLFMEGKRAYGFVIGERLSTDTYVFHFKKALREIHGLDSWMTCSVAKGLPNSFEWINLEQDLGLDTLRQAKESFQPDRIVPKWRVIPK